MIVPGPYVLYQEVLVPMHRGQQLHYSNCAPPTEYREEQKKYEEQQLLQPNQIV
jgi:hypothetical protein